VGPVGGDEAEEVEGELLMVEALALLPLFLADVWLGGDLVAVSDELAV